MLSLEFFPIILQFFCQLISYILMFCLTIVCVGTSEYTLWKACWLRISIVTSDFGYDNRDLHADVCVLLGVHVQEAVWSRVQRFLCTGGWFCSRVHQTFVWEALWSRVHLSKSSVYITLSVLEAVRSRVHVTICAGGCLEPCARISLSGRLFLKPCATNFLYQSLLSAVCKKHLIIITTSQLCESSFGCHWKPSPRWKKCCIRKDIPPQPSSPRHAIIKMPCQFFLCRRVYFV